MIGVTDTIVLTEYEDSEPIRLEVAERDALAALSKAITVTPLPETDDVYTVNPGHMVGAVQLNRLRFELRPKLAVRRLLFMLGYALDPDDWSDREFGFEDDEDVFEAIVPGFAFLLERALMQGPVQGYRYEEEALQTVRGRIDFDNHIRRFGLMPPIDCTFDEFTDDIEINRILRAAIERLGAIRMRSPETRRRLAQLLSYFSGVTAVSYDARAIPEIRFDRRTERFRAPVELARLIIGNRSIDSRSGSVSGSAFLLNLATVFEDFVVIALRESLDVGETTLRQHAAGVGLYLDEARAVKLEPDLYWEVDGRCVFVGDVKYKRTQSVGGVQNPDMYQLLAYTTATNRQQGLLVYAAGDGDEPIVDAVHRIPGAKKEIFVRALDLDVEPVAVLTQIDQLADVVRAQLPGDRVRL